MADGHTSLHQARIARSYPSTDPPTGSPKPPPRVSILDLPSMIRDRIYEEANVWKDEFIFLNLWSSDRLSMIEDTGEDFVTESSTEAVDEVAPLGLLLSGSRIIHKEVEIKLYSQNTFAVHAMGLGGLDILEKLSDTALQEIRYLIVVFLPCDCLASACLRFPIGYALETLIARPTSRNWWLVHEEVLGYGGSHNMPIRHDLMDHRRLLEQWSRICSRLAATVRPYQLKLYLYTYVDSRESFKAVLRPLRCLPPLRDVALRLSRDNRPSFSNGFDSRSSIYSIWCALLTHVRSQGQREFRFLSLPREIQTRILSYTELGDNASMEWGPATKYRSAEDEKCVGWHETRIPKSSYCARYSSSFSTFCKCCSTSPVNYFLVSKEFGTAARYVFYTNHEFRVLPTTLARAIALAAPSQNNNGVRLTLFSFLANMPRQCIQHLRHLTIVFPPLDLTYVRSSGAGLRSWACCVELLKNLSDEALLRLEIHFSDRDDLHHSVEAVADDQFYSYLMAAYRSLLEPLVLMRTKIKALLVYRAFPDHGDLPIMVARRAIENELERMVMGDQYNSSDHGKKWESIYAQHSGDVLTRNTDRIMGDQYEDDWL
ncbi:hypothetical protein BD289DRAFT_456485 [Coniella lustricola]|uniref:Uncharacterized protein n=1 Tax=Coniella lustricola TaxID=2025994 RepID=A0A2T2ZVM5_9PEZI|nr:hypothetical protein BD289DRAFT_456485 [Coniella lustricola]